MSAHYISFLLKRVYYNDMTRALASVIFILVNEFHKKRYVMSTNVRLFYHITHLEAFKTYFITASALDIFCKNVTFVPGLRQRY